ncbi:hypothetical protein [Sphingobacterium sp. LRF_L2]|uniref:hypothetical protein n=1 Tax=Sphingobacterium sp. LRF_L2 TaxID=3369421 RepID=UPI003F639D3B
MMIRIFIITTLFALFLNSLYAQERSENIKTYYPKDSVQFENDTDFPFQNGPGYENKSFGKTTMITTARTNVGVFYFVFKKKILNTEDFMDSDARDVLTEHNLYAFIFLEDHNGLIQKARFRDFGNPVYWPQFDYQNCTISDEDNDGLPEFYLAYFGDSDGLDAKPYLQIVYTIPLEKGKPFLKSKATAYYPAGNEEDIYEILFDENWEKLTPQVKAKSKGILDRHREKYGLEDQ